MKSTMPVSWSSPSSDEDLRTSLLLNSRSTNSRAIARPLACLSVIHNGDAVTVRYGTIYCPLRKKYFHIHAVKRSPETYFGDGGVKRSKRRRVPRESVILWDASNIREITDRTALVTLVEVADNGFYIYNSTGISRCSPAFREPNFRNGLDFRYFRVVRPETFVSFMQSPEALRSEKHYWTSAPYRMQVSSVMTTLEDGRFVFYAAEPKPCLNVVENNVLTRHEVDFFQPNSAITGIYAIDAESVVLVGGREVTHMRWDPANPTASKDVFTSCHTFGFPQCLSSTSSHVGDGTCILLGSGRDLFAITVPGEVSPIIKRVCWFRTTPISSVEIFSLGYGSNPLALCGMRNGNIRVVPLHGPLSFGLSDTSPKHKEASVSYLHGVENTFNFVSVASNGEAKLWDLRYLRSNEPVHEMCCAVGGSRFCGAEAAFLDDMACISSPLDCSVYCFNVRKWALLGKIQRFGGTRGRLHVVRSLCGYDLLEASEQDTLIHSLSIF